MMQTVMIVMLLAAAAPGDALPAVAPVTPMSPVPTATVEAFTERFGDALTRVRGTETPADDGGLAEAIFLDARGRVDEPQAVGLALDYVVRLASRSQAHQDLAYAALRTQARGQLRPADACYGRMMTLAPRVLAQLAPGARGAWVESTWSPDALTVAETLLDRGLPADAARVLEQVAAACAASDLAAPVTVSSNAAGLAHLAAAASGGGATSGKGGVYVAVHLLVAGAPSVQVAGALRASGGGPALELAAAMQDATEGRATPEQRERIVRAADPMALPSLIQRLVLAKLGERFGGAHERLVDQSFFGVSFSGASRIVFVVDHSGSMTQRLVLAKQELKRALASLHAGQSFHVVFFNTGADEMPGQPLFAATAPNKQAAAVFIDGMGSGGGTNPTTALERAFALRPDMVNLLTDGEFQPTIAEVVRRLNPSRRTRVNTICFVSVGGQSVLQQIARENRGSFRFVQP